MALADVLGFESVDFLKNIDTLSPALSAFHDGFGNLEDCTQLQVPPYENVSVIGIEQAELHWVYSNLIIFS